MCLLCFCVRRRRRWRFGPGSAQNRRSQSIIVHIDSGGGSIACKSFSRLVCLISTLAHLEPSTESKGDISIRGARHDRIAAHKLKTSLPRRCKLERNENRSTHDERVPQTLCPQKQLNHTTQPRWPTSGASRSVFPSIQTRAQKNATRPRARADKTEEWTSRRAQNATAATQVPPAQEDARRGNRASASSPSRTPEVRRTSTPASTNSVDARTTS